MENTEFENRLDMLVEQVQKGESYREIQVELIRSIGRRELREQRNLRAAVKATRSKLHQVGGAYLPNPPDYAGWVSQLEQLPPDRNTPELKRFCLETMRAHASTRERLPIVETFFYEVLAGIAPIRSILDLACGLNPLSLPWIPLDNDAVYYACDIYGDMVSFISHFFAHLRQNGRVWSCDLSQGFPEEQVHLALLLKAIPCLEQLDKGLPLRLLERIQAQHLLVSFPVTSLGGRGKGMRANYETHFRQLVSGKPWLLERLEFPGELAFLITK
jgi:16S rRNA (guanine(1405)-N(7))-methyltransferase